MRIIPDVRSTHFNRATGRCALLFVPFDRGFALAAFTAPSPTGWKTASRRRGPDPSFTTSIRRAGQG